MFDSDTTFLKKWGLRVLPNKLKLIKKEAVPQGAASSNFRKWVHIRNVFSGFFCINSA